MPNFAHYSESMSKASNVAFKAILKASAAGIEDKIREGFAANLDFYGRKRYKDSAINAMKKSLNVEISGGSVVITVNSPILYHSFSFPDQWRDAIEYAVSKTMQQCLV